MLPWNFKGSRVKIKEEREKNKKIKKLSIPTRARWPHKLLVSQSGHHKHSDTSINFLITKHFLYEPEYKKKKKLRKKQKILEP